MMVIKVGGVLLENAEEAVQEIKRVGRQPFVVVHGGGIQITRMLDRMKVTSTFIDGLRVTDPQTLGAVATALLGEVHTALVTELQRAGARAVGMFGVVHASQKTGPWGLVGDNVRVDANAIETVLAAGLTPVIPTLAIGRESLLNVNGDETAAALAQAVRASALVFLTDVEGVKDGDGKVMEHAEDPQELLTAPFVSGGMIPKLRAVGSAMKGGVTEVRVGRTLFRSNA